MFSPSGRRSPVDKPAPDKTPETIVKLMSLDIREFRRALVKFAPETRHQGERNDYLLGDEVRGLRIRIEELPPFSPGGLIVLPQCRITLEFHGIGEGGRQAMLARFDRTYFRGGG
jgi:hypothetical protein